MAQSGSAENLEAMQAKPYSLMMAVAGWLLVLPATFFLAVGAIRLLQPRQFQPARACWIIFEWARAHVSHLDAAVMFLGLPLIALVVGGGALWREWRRNEALRQDAAGAFARVRRQFGTVVLAAAVLVAGGILTFAVNHLIVG
jgi:hypothetical protein